ncbi:unnamed protein product, partial [Mesorhabditis belari]|uniref:Uncharacterized protein n=1 Tax=Mesorhabditis belari TaxID=2138241 RepID=A0AAF3E965_9BILA
MYQAIVKDRISLCDNDTNNLLATVHSLGAELDKELTSVMTKISVHECELPTKLAKLKELREELLSYRKQIVELRDEHARQKNAIVDLLKESFEVDALTNLMSHQTELNNLKAIASLVNKIALCKTLIKGNSEDSFKVFLEILADEAELEIVDVQECIKIKKEVETLAEEIYQVALGAFEKNLDSLGYPFDIAVDWGASSSKGQLMKAIKVAILSKDHCNSSGVEAVMDVVFQRFRKRFHYHFYGARKTNDSSHPEWYFQQLIQWILHSLPFFTSIFNEFCANKLNASEEFIQHISTLANAKTTDLLSQTTVVADTLLFSHIIDEAINFERMRSTYDPKNKGESALKPFCEEDVIRRWTNIEQTVCSARLDEILHGDSKFEDRFSKELGSLDDYRVVECADAFVALLTDLGQRAQMLPEESATRRIISVIVVLVDEFRARLAQIARFIDVPLNNTFLCVMNSIWYLACVFEEWSDSLSFTDHLGPLKESAKMYRFMWIQMCDELVKHICDSFASYLTDYKRQNWLSPNYSEGISPHFCSGLHNLRSNLTACSTVLSPSSFDRFFMGLIKAIVDIMEIDVIFSCKFSQPGAQAMLTDINDYLLPVLRSISSRTKTTEEEATGHVLSTSSWEDVLQPVLEILRFLALSSSQLQSFSQSLENQPEELIDERLKLLNFNIEHFVSSGEKEKTKELLLVLLENSGWMSEIHNLCRQFLLKNGVEVTVDEMYNSLKGPARKAVSEEVKRKLFDLIREFVIRYGEIEDL